MWLEIVEALWSPWLLLIAYSVVLLIVGGLFGWYFGENAGYRTGVNYGYNRAKEKYGAALSESQFRVQRDRPLPERQDTKVWDDRQRGAGAMGPREHLWPRGLSEHPEREQRGTQPPTTGHASAANRMIKLYNTDPATFRQTYQPERFGVTNAADLMRRREVAPIFDRSEGGSFWLLSTTDSSHYYLVPRAGLVVSNAEFEAGGMAALFTTRPPYHSGSRYREITLIRPARVKAIGGHWEISELGELELGGEEREA
jgi:hypothetical protein